MLSYLKARKMLNFATKGASFAAKNAYRLPYKSTTAMYWLADTVCPEYELEEVNTLLKVIPTMAVIWACNSPLLPLMALGFNYQTSLDNLESQSTYQDLKALADGTAPQPQSFAAHHHVSNLFCALSFGFPGIIVASLINQSIQNWWDNPASKQVELDSLKEAAGRRETATITRLEANPVFNGLPENVRTTIAAHIVPALAEFSHRNDDTKKTNFAAAAACLLKDTLSQQGLVGSNAQATSLLRTVCNDSAVGHVAANINANTPKGINIRNMPDVKALYETFQHRVERINAVRSGRE